ncbi:MAG: hypothetical protein OEZ22_02900 [Spirochaetia bacterium]|nr:hypothetical protein [Spirochaetia bacterium]
MKKFVKNIKFKFLIPLFLFVPFLLLFSEENKSYLFFSHKLHLKFNKIDCFTCHTLNEEKTSLITHPDHTKCVNCHDVQEPEDCVVCHSHPEQKVKKRENILLYEEISFDHLKHIAEKELPCLKCHEDALRNSTIKQSELFPKMKICINCHDEYFPQENNNCQFCHEKDIQNIKPVTHNNFWLKKHGKNLTRTERAECKSCHSVTSNKDCFSCHQKEKPKNHNLAFRIKGHGYSAVSDRESCNTCHTEAACINCHSKTTPVSHTALWGGKYSRHCNNCHLEDSEYSSISGGFNSKCQFCHDAGTVSAKHRSSPLLPMHRGSGCYDCHGTGGKARVKHPMPPENSCRTCH